MNTYPTINGNPIQIPVEAIGKEIAPDIIPVTGFDQALTVVRERYTGLTRKGSVQAAHDIMNVVEVELEWAR